ncbi:MAG: sulfatase-like hydrolase/transferase, partial [Sediminibacterium sp.]
MRFKFIITVMVFGVFLGVSLRRLRNIQKTQVQRAKNVLIIYSDDQSFATIHALGNKQIKTPNLDKLVARGLTFTQAHVMGGHQGAVCIPSRVMLLTGRYVNRLPGDG